LEGSAVLDIAREAIVTLIMVSGPIMLVALVVGILIALFQALTSIQEATLTFVPKILLVFVILLVLLPFMAGRLESLTTDLFARMANPDGPPLGQKTGAEQ
jgi:flagellar biosynthetic protein FliQ